MKLDISTTEAIILSTSFAALFVVSLYIWTFFEKEKEIGHLCIFRRPKNKPYSENSPEEIKKRITSVAFFSFFTVLFIYMRANHDMRSEVSLFQWFGMTINEKTFLAVANALVINSILFLGEFA